MTITKIEYTESNYGALVELYMSVPRDSRAVFGFLGGSMAMTELNKTLDGELLPVLDMGRGDFDVDGPCGSLFGRPVFEVITYGHRLEFASIAGHLSKWAEFLSEEINRRGRLLRNAQKEESMANLHDHMLLVAKEF